MHLKICLSMILVATLIASACAKGPSPEELVAPTMESFTAHLMEREDAPGVIRVTDFEIVINNPNSYEGEMIYNSLDYNGAGGIGGGACVDWSTTLISANGLTTLKYTSDGIVTEFPKEDLPFKVSGFIRIDFVGVKSFDVPVEGVSGD